MTAVVLIITPSPILASSFLSPLLPLLPSPYPSGEVAEDNIKLLKAFAKHMKKAELPDLDDSEINKAQKMLDNMNDGTTDYEEAQADMAKFMRKHGETPKYSDEGKEYTDLGIQFELFISKAKFKPHKKKFQNLYDSWDSASADTKHQHYHALFTEVEVRTCSRISCCPVC